MKNGYSEKGSRLSDKPIISSLAATSGAASLIAPDPLIIATIPLSAPACIITSVAGIKNALNKTRSKLSRAFGAAAALTGTGALIHFGYEATNAASIVDIMLSPTSTLIGMTASGGFNVLSYATRSKRNNQQNFDNDQFNPEP